MRTFLRFTLFLMTGLAAFGQGEVRYVDTIEGLLRQNPYASGTGSRAVYAVGRRTTNSPSGSVRFAIWSTSTNQTANGTNVFASPFGGRWVFPDKDDPIQNADWYSQTNKWSLDHAGNLILGTTNVAGDLSALRTLLGTKANVVDLSGYSVTNHDHPVIDIRDSTPITRTLIQQSTAENIRAVLLLGNAATRNVGATSNDVAQGNHLHDGIYDLLGTAATLVSQHSAQTNPHPVYVLGNSGNATNISIVGGAITGDWTLSLGGGDINAAGSHRLLVREATTGNWKTMDMPFFKGWLDLHASNVVDAGVTGVQLLQAEEKTNVLDVLATGRSPSLFLRGDGSWATVITTNLTTNSLPEAPNDGTAYARKNAGWTGLAITDVSGLTSFGQSWVALGSSTSAVSTLRLTGTNSFTIDSPAKYSIRVNSGTNSTRHRLNIIPGTSIGLLMTDDSVDDESDITIYLTNLVSSQITDSTAQGRALLTNSTASAQRTVLGLGTAATNNIPSSGNAATNQVVTGSDTRLTDSRTPTSHTHAPSDIPSIGFGNVIGRKSSGTGVAEQITPSELANILINAGLSTGTVKSVSLSMPGIFSVSGSPVTNIGTLSVSAASQAQKTFWAGPVSGVNSSPAFRLMELTDLPVGAWTIANDGTGSGLDSDLLDGQHGVHYLSRANHSGTQPWSTIAGTPTNIVGYGITDAASIASLQAHINNGVTDSTRPHGIGHAGGLLVQMETIPELRDILELGTASLAFIPESGNATNHPSHGPEVVIATDTRLTDSRSPTSHGHGVTGITNVTSQRILGRLSSGSGAAEEITWSQLATGIVGSGSAPTGTVRSVGLSVIPSAIFGVSGSPVTNSGTLAIAMNSQPSFSFLAGPNFAGPGGMPSFRVITTNDMPGGVWMLHNDGTGSGMDSDLLDGQHGTFYLYRSNHVGTIDWSNVAGTPTTRSGYGITDVPLTSEFLSHVVSEVGAHGMAAWGASFVKSTSQSVARTNLGLGTVATLNVASSGNAASGEAVKGNDTRLTDARTPVSHTHPVSDLSDGGTIGKQIVQASVKTNVLNLLGSGGATGLFLTWDGWTTAPGSGSPTNGITEAPTNGLAYARKNAAWTQVSMSDISGMSVGLTVPGPFSVSGSPVTSSGTLAVSVSNQVEKTFWAGPVSGANAPPTFRSIQETDLPQTYWYAGNDGAGSGLDSDLLDAQSGDYYLARSNHTGTQSWSTVSGTPTTVDGYGITDALKLTGGTMTGALIGNSGRFTNGLSLLAATTSEPVFSAASGVSVQIGAGASDTFSWAYPYGQKLIVNENANLAWELIPTSYYIGSMAFRQSSNGVAWMPWKTMLDSTNFTDYAPTKTGSGASGTWGISITGAASTATNVDFSGITSTPSTLAGYGITNGTVLSDFVTHTNLTAGAHGISSFGSTLVDDASASAARTTLGLGTSATLNAPASGDAASGEVVKGSDTRLTDARTPSAHSHQSTSITNVSTKTVIGRLTTGTGAAEQISMSNLLSSLRTDGGLSYGSVSNVSLSMPGSVFSVSGSPITTAGTLAVSFANQSAATFFAGPTLGSSNGVPAFRALAIGDMPGGVWTSLNDGTDSGLHADILDDHHGTYYLDRYNHTGVQSFSTIDPLTLPTTAAGHGITDAATDAELAAHAATTVGVHGISSFGATLVDDVSSGAARTTLGLGTSSVLDVASSGDASSSQVVKGNDSRLTDARTPLTHNHDERYDISGSSTYTMFVHTNNANPHSQYMLANNGSSVNQSAIAISISGNSSVSGNLSLNVSDVNSGGSHRFAVRDATSGVLALSTPSFAKGILDIRSTDIGDSGSAGRSILQASTTTSVLDTLGSGRTSSTYLRGDGTWATPPSGGGATNGITDAPNDGTAYVRKSASWTGLAFSDVSGPTTYGRNWVTLLSSSADARENLGLMGGSVVTIDSPAKVAVRQNDTGSGSARHRLNFTAGNGISMSVSDDSVSDENDVFIGFATGDYGDVTVGGGGSTMTVDNGAITYAKIQNVTAGAVLGRGTTTGGAPQEISLGTGLAMSGTTLSVNPATFTSGEILCAISDEVEITGGQLTDDTWHSILGNPRAGSKTIQANAVPVSGIIKIEIYGDCGFDGTAGDGMGKIRVNIGNNFSAVMTMNEDGSLGADNDTPWSVTMVLTLKAGNVVRASGGWSYAVTSSGTTSGLNYMARVVPTGTINPTIANAISAEFRGKTVDTANFNQFRCSQTIVTRY